ncbi:glycosyltransferase family 76 protein [Lyophyllum atratum]|nr:glycosyltransferase family 76 protein [Lyophyllum atratum]
MRLTLLSRLLSFLVLIVAHRLLPLFDASPRLVPQAAWFQPLVRWDSLHYQAITNNGYTYENQWAFLPGTPFLMHVLRFGASNSFLWPLALLAVASDMTQTLYELTRHHFPASPSLARLVCLLSLLPSSPATLHFAPYGEAFFTWLSYKGMLYAAKESWLFATLCFTLASTFRSNGIMLSGYLVWGLVISPSKIAYSLILTACVFSPLVYHNYTAYRLFCLSGDSKPEWCHRVPPSIYTYVQSKYWNCGFLRYWEPAQIPNFVLAAPPLALLVIFSTQHLLAGFVPRLYARFAHPSVVPQAVTARMSPFMSLSITPHLIHTLVMCVTLAFFSHTQIVLRLAAALPTLYWGAAWLLLGESESDKKHWGRIWIGWSTTWGLVSLGLWAAFLPPA